MIRYILTFVVTFIAFSLSAQELPERGLTRKGNRYYNKNEYKSAIESYDKAYQVSPDMFDTQYNYANALHKDEQYAKAEEIYKGIDIESVENDADRADLFYNLGNSQFMQQKYKEALESFKSAIRLDPTDQQAKYNYAYTKKLLDDQQNEDQNGGDDQNKDQNQDQQDQNQDQNKDQGDQNKDQQDKGDQNKDQQDQGDQNQDQQNGDKDKNGDQQQQPSEGKISPQEQQQILDAIQAQEDKTQDKLDEKEGRGVIVKGRKNW